MRKPPPDLALDAGTLRRGAPRLRLFVLPRPPMPPVFAQTKMPITRKYQESIMSLTFHK
jgi:hypothetical protein